MSVSTLFADIGFHLGRPATMCSCDVLFLLSLGLYFALLFMLGSFVAAFEGDAVKNNGSDVVRPTPAPSHKGGVRLIVIFFLSCIIFIIVSITCSVSNIISSFEKRISLLP